MLHLFFNDFKIMLLILEVSLINHWRALDQHQRTCNEAIHLITWQNKRRLLCQLIFRDNRIGQNLDKDKDNLGQPSVHVNSRILIILLQNHSQRKKGFWDHLIMNQSNRTKNCQLSRKNSKCLGLNLNCKRTKSRLMSWTNPDKIRHEDISHPCQLLPIQQEIKLILLPMLMEIKEMLLIGISMFLREIWRNWILLIKELMIQLKKLKLDQSSTLKRKSKIEFYLLIHSKRWHTKRSKRRRSPEFQHILNWLSRVRLPQNRQIPILQD